MITFAVGVVLLTPFPLFQWDTFSKVITLLSEDLEVTSGEKILLSHKTTTMKPTDSPGSLNLTTADIIGVW